jgi:hypothetical protein
MSDPVMNYARRLAIGATGASPTKQLQFLRCASRGAPAHVNYPGVRGKRGIVATSSYEGIKDVGLSFTGQPSADELAAWLKYILGGNPSGDTYPLAEALPYFTAMVDAGNTVYSHDYLKVATATFSSDQNNPLTLAIEALGKNRVGGATFPSLTNLTVKRPYTHHELTVSIDGTAYKVQSSRLSINNNLDGNRFLNSQTRTEIPEGERLVQLVLMMPFGSSEYSAFNAMDLNTGVEAIVTYEISGGDSSRAGSVCQG